MANIILFSFYLLSLPKTEFFLVFFLSVPREFISHCCFVLDQKSEIESISGRFFFPCNLSTLSKFMVLRALFRSSLFYLIGQYASGVIFYFSKALLISLTDSSWERESLEWFPRNYETRNLNLRPPGPVTQDLGPGTPGTIT